MQRRMRVEDDEVESFVVPDYFKVAEDVESRAYIYIQHLAEDMPRSNQNVELIRR